jgi:hypothetical protein
MDKRDAMLLEGLSTGVPYSCGGLRFMFTENHPSGCRGQGRPSRYITPDTLPARRKPAGGISGQPRGIVMTFKLPEDIATASR